MIKDTQTITATIEKAAAEARQSVKGEVKPAFVGNVEWPTPCSVGPGLEGAIACETEVGYVNGSQGVLIYRGYDVYDLCAHSSYEEVAYLLLLGKLPTESQLKRFRTQVVERCHLPKTLRLLMSFPVENMHAMAALRLGTNLMRQEFTTVDHDISRPDTRTAIGTDEDSIAMETLPTGDKRAVYEFDRPGRLSTVIDQDLTRGVLAAMHVMGGVNAITATIARLKRGLMPIEPDPELGFAANYLYMLTGKKPSPVEERIMDITLILHADHGMNASTFAAIVVASTLSDIYGSVGAGIAALSGPLHGGANEQVIQTLEGIGGPANVDSWYKQAVAKKEKIPGFGHRVYKVYDPRARILGPLAKSLARANAHTRKLYETAATLEKRVIGTLGQDKGVYPNVDFYSGLVYRALGIPTEFFTPTFAVARTAGWTARVLEYLEHNRLFRPRAIYTGPTDLAFVPMAARGRTRRKSTKAKA